jgi:hypothetical protein
MAARVKTKTKSVTASLTESSDVIRMFNGVLQTDGGALLIIAPKYAEMRDQCARFTRVLRLLANSKAVAACAPEAARYADAMAAAHEAAFRAPDLEPHMAIPNEGIAAYVESPDRYARVPPYAASEFRDVYMAAKKSPIVEAAIGACQRLTAHKAALADADKLSDLFITRSAGTMLAPLEGLPKFNLKTAYINRGMTDSDRRFLLLLMHKLFVVGRAVYDVVTTPDVDVEEFIKIVLPAIKDLRKQIPRCDKAFKHIEDSVDLLRDNFGRYHRDFVSSGNSAIIVESFIGDVVKNSSGVSPQVAQQFMKIITHYKKLVHDSGVSANPELTKLIDHVGDKFSDFERRAKTLAEELDDEDDE